MIESITFQLRYNKNYKNHLLHPSRIFGTQYIDGLISLLEMEKEAMDKTHSLVAELNKDLTTKDIPAIIKKYFPDWQPKFTAKTKTKRSYYVEGLTIHEEDF